MLSTSNSTSVFGSNPIFSRISTGIGHLALGGDAHDRFSLLLPVRVIPGPEPFRRTGATREVFFGGAASQNFVALLIVWPLADEPSLRTRPFPRLPVPAAAPVPPAKASLDSVHSRKRLLGGAVDHVAALMSTLSPEPRFTVKQGQYLAFIHAHALVNGRPPGRGRSEAPLRCLAAQHPSNGRRTRAARTHQPPTALAAKDGGNPRPR